MAKITAYARINDNFFRMYKFMTENCKTQGTAIFCRMCKVDSNPNLTRSIALKKSGFQKKHSFQSVMNQFN